MLPASFSLGATSPLFPCAFGKSFISARLPVSEYPRQPGLRFEEPCFVIDFSKNEVVADRETILNRRAYVCYDSHIRIKHEVRIYAAFSSLESR